jgi:hypothetical protein
MKLTLDGLLFYARTTRFGRFANAVIHRRRKGLVQDRDDGLFGGHLRVLPEWYRKCERWDVDLDVGAAAAD